MIYFRSSNVAHSNRELFFLLVIYQFDLYGFGIIRGVVCLHFKVFLKSFTIKMFEQILL